MVEKLHIAFRNYLISRGIPVVFIDFDNSLVEVESDTGYQLLVLKKPNPHAFEVEPLEWPYEAEKALLYFSLSSERVFSIPLDFEFRSSGKDTIYQFSFSQYSSLKICEDHIMVTAIGRESGGNRCSDIALFTTQGAIVSAWKICNSNGYEVEIKDFHQLNQGYWVVSLEIDEREEHKPAVKKLCLLSTSEIEDINLSLDEIWNPDIGSLLAAKTKEISSWFAEKGDAPHVFVLAGYRQCCIYRYSVYKYDKIADITLENPIKGFRATLADWGMSIEFDHYRKSAEPSKFFLSF